MSLMATPKTFQIAVSLPTFLPQAPTQRNWKYKEEKDIGYKYFKTNDVEGEPNTNYSYNETANAVCRLVNPAREITAREIETLGEIFKGAKVKDELEPKKVELFLNTYGQIGLADYARREKFSRPFTPDQGEMTGQQFASLCGIHPRFVENIEKVRKENPKEWATRLMRLQWGREIPFSWIQKDLFELNYVILILASLQKNYTSQKSIYSLENKWGKERNRFLLATDRAVVPFGKNETYRPQDSKIWSIEERILEAEWEKFASNLNRFITPISRNVFSTQAREKIALENCGIETWIVCSIVQSQASFTQKRCANPTCQKPFFPRRAIKRFCGSACESTVRTRRNRAKNKKKSSGKSQKKAQAKGKKKNG